MSVFIIAEAGVNHNGSIDLAKQMVDIAKESGADAIKFQTFRAENLVLKSAPKANYQINTSSKKETQFQMLKNLELNFEDHKELFNYCNQRQILFISSPFDIESVDFLYELGVDIFKIASGEITNLPLLRRIGSLNKSVILSTGMSNLAEVRLSLELLINAGTSKENITILHANTMYPTPFEDVNLLAMLTIRDELDVRVGYSDHTPGIEVDIAAVALGAKCIEKHFTIDKGMPGPDHKASLNPVELLNMVNSIRNIELALGRYEKEVSDSEKPNISIARKSIYASKSIKKGDVFNEDNITVKRPGNGVSPMRWDEIIGMHAPRDFEKDEMIDV